VTGVGNVNFAALGKNFLMPLLMSPVTPEWAEQITGVPAAKIREIASNYAKQKPAANKCATGRPEPFRGPIRHDDPHEREAPAGIFHKPAEFHGVNALAWTFGLQRAISTAKPVRKMRE
jgi:hypothetical protein